MKCVYVRTGLYMKLYTELGRLWSQRKIQQNVEVCEFYLISLLFSPKKVAVSLVKSSESIFEMFILCFQSYLSSFCQWRIQVKSK